MAYQLMRTYSKKEPDMTQQSMTARDTQSRSISDPVTKIYR